MRNGLEIRNGDLSDLRKGLSLIRAKISEKSAISLKEVKNRLCNRDYHIKILEKNSRLEGVYIWYGPYHKKSDCYLWLGTVREVGKGRGFLLMRSVLNDMKSCGYSEVYVKVKQNNLLAFGCLNRCGFRFFTIEKRGIIIMKKEL